MKDESTAQIYPDNGKTYWGVSCRTCRDLVAFDVGPCPAFGLGTAILRPGAIRCLRGHNHIYFPRDFRFFTSDTPIAEVTMQTNRATYIAINPPSGAVSIGMEN